MQVRLHPLLHRPIVEPTLDQQLELLVSGSSIPHMFNVVLQRIAAKYDGCESECLLHSQRIDNCISLVLQTYSRPIFPYFFARKLTPRGLIVAASLVVNTMMLMRETFAGECDVDGGGVSMRWRPFHGQCWPRWDGVHLETWRLRIGWIPI